LIRVDAVVGRDLLDRSLALDRLYSDLCLQIRAVLLVTIQHFYQY
jgi:hypothetical protein